MFPRAGYATRIVLLKLLRQGAVMLLVEYRISFQGTLIYFLLWATSLQAQDLEKIGKAAPLKINGGFSLNQIFSHATSQAGRDPYTYVAIGNLTASIYGWSIPVSFTFSNEQFTYQQPFNQYALHPTYKWFSAHLGYTSVNFSPYTVNGHLFLGAAVDLTPGKWNVSSFYGRLLKETLPDTTLNAPGSFERWAYGIKAGYSMSATSVSVSMFHAKDRIGSNSDLLLANGVLPQQNLASGVEISQKLLKNVLLRCDWGGTLITNNLLSPASEEDSVSSTIVVVPTTSTAFYHAFKSSIAYQGKMFSIGTNYEHIDPGYRTLGAYYFNNDLENISLNGSLQFLKNKVSIAASSGLQRDNLDNAKASDLSRWVGSLNVSVLASEHLNIQGSYSNFSTFTNIRSPFLSINQTTPYSNLDTLNYTQLSQTANTAITYNILSDKKRLQSLIINCSIQTAAEKQGAEMRENSNSRFYNSILTYMVALLERNVTLSVSGNYSKIMSPINLTDMYGPVVSFGKMMFDNKLKMNAAASWNTTRNDVAPATNIYTTRLNSNYQLATAHQLQLSIAWMQRQTLSTERDKVSDLTIMFGYNYNF